MTTAKYFTVGQVTLQVRFLRQPEQRERVKIGRTADWLAGRACIIWLDPVRDYAKVYAF